MEWSSVNIMAKELVPIIISCAVWGPLLKQRSTEFHCDNQCLVAVINKGSSKDAVVMHLLRCLWFFTTVFDIHITATHIAGKLNKAADMLSRNQAAKFLIAHPHMPISLTPLPPSLLCLMSPQMLDWTSPKFHRLSKDLHTGSATPQNSQERLRGPTYIATVCTPTHLYYIRLCVSVVS